MNRTIELLKEVRDLIGTEPFDYGSVDYPKCGTPGCIGGWLCTLGVNSGEIKLTEGFGFTYLGRDDSPIKTACRWAGLPSDLMDSLCYGLDHSEAGINFWEEGCDKDVQLAQDRIDKVVAYLESLSEKGQAVNKIRQLANEAISIQDACNLLGLSKRFPIAIQELADALRSAGQYGTSEVSRHPVTKAWVDKLLSLSGEADYLALYAITEGTGGKQ